ncbi:hypothetical protein [Oceanobacillus sp. Castelsardo]|uniref:hypothetical protein n=1 Tax=Oceanobacillus sp. Castelsardo TaxID=1851204 RepID=UPI0012E907FB|nr:hypothetical protein [Oceanobacillus sp. Castelsardo]
MIDFFDGILISMAGASETIEKSKKENKRKEQQRRSKMTPEERSYEDTCKFNKRLSRG